MLQAAQLWCYQISACLTYPRCIFIKHFLQSALYVPHLPLIRIIPSLFVCKPSLPHLCLLQLHQILLIEANHLVQASFLSISFSLSSSTDSWNQLGWRSFTLPNRVCATSIKAVCTAVHLSSIVPSIGCAALALSNTSYWKSTITNWSSPSSSPCLTITSFDTWHLPFPGE